MRSRRRISILLILCLFVILGLSCSGSEEDEGGGTQAQSQTAKLPSPPSESPSPAPAEPEPPFDSKLLIGVWTTSVIDVENDMRQDLIVTYEGDRFTIDGDFSSSNPENLKGPWQAFQVSGTWKIEGDELSETSEASSFPFWRVGVTSRAKLEILNDTTLQFVRSRKTMTYTRQ